MHKIYLEPRNYTFTEIMGNGKKYTIPRFQRDYSWDKEQWEMLWNDIINISQNQQQCFMGYIVLETDDDRTFCIIDGQQRITTLSLFVLALMSCLKKMAEKGEETKANEERLNDIRKQYIGVLNLRTLKIEAKLTLNRNSEQYFNEVATHIGIRAKTRLHLANKQIKKCFEYFQDKLRDKTSEELIELLDNFGAGLLFTTVTANNSEQAYTLFETLNARGVHLTSSDLIKNYLLHTLSQDKQYTEEDFDNFDETWAEIIDELGDMQFTNFLRAHYSMSHIIITKAGLYKAIKRQINTVEQVFPYIQGVQKYSSIYSLLQNPSNEHWQQSESRSALEMLKLYKISAPLNVLMAAYEKYGYKSKEFFTLLRKIEIFSMRYNVICHFNPNEQEKLYNNMAQAIMQEKNIDDVIKMIKPLYPNDEKFKLTFADKSMPSRGGANKIRFILNNIEEHLRDGRSPENDLTAEHVLPFSYNEEWEEYFGVRDCELAVDRLGNFALLPARDNMAHEPWDYKKQVLLASNCMINQNMAKKDKWDIESVSSHQNWLAKQAVALWRISEFD